MVLKEIKVSMVFKVLQDGVLYLKEILRLKQIY